MADENRKGDDMRCRQDNHIPDSWKRKTDTFLPQQLKIKKVFVRIQYVSYSLQKLIMLNMKINKQLNVKRNFKDK